MRRYPKSGPNPVIPDEVRGLLRDLASLILRTEQAPVHWFHALNDYAGSGENGEVYNFRRLAGWAKKGMGIVLPDWPPQRRWPPEIPETARDRSAATHPSGPDSPAYSP